MLRTVSDLDEARRAFLHTIHVFHTTGAGPVAGTGLEHVEGLTQPIAYAYALAGAAGQIDRESLGPTLDHDRALLSQYSRAVDCAIATLAIPGHASLAGDHLHTLDGNFRTADAAPGAVDKVDQPGGGLRGRRARQYGTNENGGR
ncbi:MAG: hypothetical protein ACKVQQ_06200 [Burkholderiales bacterium]